MHACMQSNQADGRVGACMHACKSNQADDRVGACMHVSSPIRQMTWWGHACTHEVQSGWGHACMHACMHAVQSGRWQGGGMHACMQSNQARHSVGPCTAVQSGKAKAVRRARLSGGGHEEGNKALAPLAWEAG